MDSSKDDGRFFGDQPNSATYEPPRDKPGTTDPQDPGHSPGERPDDKGESKDPVADLAGKIASMIVDSLKELAAVAPPKNPPTAD